MFSIFQLPFELFTVDVLS